MSESEDDLLICPRCSSEVKMEDEFCSHCGELFADGTFCSRHLQEQATGVCIICALPYCGDCGGIVGNGFLCDRHSMHEIYEGMVRIYGVLDDLAAQYAKSCLEQAGLHPVLFCRTQPKGGPRFAYTLNAAAGDYDGHIVNEIKVMVPSQEVEEAERVLISLDIKRSPKPSA